MPLFEVFSNTKFTKQSWNVCKEQMVRLLQRTFFKKDSQSSCKPAFRKVTQVHRGKHFRPLGFSIFQKLHTHIVFSALLGELHQPVVSVFSLHLGIQRQAMSENATEHSLSTQTMWKITTKLKPYGFPFHRNWRHHPYKKVAVINTIKFCLPIHE